MATDFTQESVLGFLRCNRGRVKNSELLAHFNYFLKQDENRLQNRELFKKFVNTVAVVKHEDGVSYVVLRKKFKVPGGDIGSSTQVPKRQEEKPENPRSRHRERSPRKATSRSRERMVSGETSSNLKTNNAVQVPASVACERSVDILPAAGIVNNNNNNVETVNFEKTVIMSPPQTWESSPPSIIVTEGNYSTRTLKPSQTPPFSNESKRSSGSGQSFEQAWDKEPVETPVLEHNSVDISNLGRQSREADGCSTTFRPTSVSGHSDLETFSLEELRPHPELQQLQQGTQSRNAKTQPVPWPLHPSLLANSPGISSSSPCIADIESAPLTKAAHQMSSSNDCLIRPKREHSDHVRGELVHARAAAAVNSPLQRRSLPLDPTYMPATAAADHHYHTPLSSTHDCLSGSDCEWPFPLTQDTWSSDDSLNQRVPLGSPSDQVREMLQRAHDAKLLSLLHRPERTQPPGYHRSLGFLDQESPCSGTAAAPGSAPENFLRLPSRRGSQRHRGRLSRSLGAGLDQPFPEDHEAARHNRLLLLSSSLSINYPLAGSPDRPPSSRDVSLSGASSTDSLSPCSHDRAFVQRSSLIPLEPKEHEWMVKAATGDWPSIYSLFRDDSSLLAKKDFISGYTVLHWIAKHGDHRVLNTLWYGVNKAGMKLDVDVQTTCGYTPLHLAAMYGHKKLIRLLVHKFKANVRLRDTSGRRAWHYLGGETTGEIPQILGAPQKKKGTGGSPHAHHGHKPAERPATVSATVKRHSSLAALFKHKSLGRMAGHTEMSV